MTGRGRGGADGDRDSPVRGDGGGRQSRRADKYPLASQLGGGEWNLEKWKLVSCPLLRHPSPRQPACYRHTNNQTFVCVSPPPLSSSSLRIDPSAAAARTGSDSSAALSKHFCRGSMIYCGFLPCCCLLLLLPAACCITKPLYEQ